MTELDKANQRIAALETELAAMRAGGGLTKWRLQHHPDEMPDGEVVDYPLQSGDFAEGWTEQLLYTHPKPAAQDAERIQALELEVRQQSKEIAGIREALQFYADRHHFMLSDDSAWDTVSDEPQNLWCDEAGTATVEDGHFARAALAGTAPAQQPAPSATVTDADIAAARELLADVHNARRCKAH